MPLLTVRPDDPRTQRLAYITNGTALYEVLDDSRGVLVLENCLTGFKLTVGRSRVASWRLVKAAPEACPDTPMPEPVNSD